MLFPDYIHTGVVYHVINLNDLQKVREQGIKYDNKFTYANKYENFHEFLNAYKPQFIPDWVDRSKGIFASINFADDHQWHSHSMLLALKIDPARCWVANENKANILYEPFVLHRLEEFYKAEKFLNGEGRKIIKEYWETSLSFMDNLIKRKDKEPEYDAEVMIFHPVKPEGIHCLAIVSDHRMMTVKHWKETFCKG